MVGEDGLLDLDGAHAPHNSCLAAFADGSFAVITQRKSIAGDFISARRNACAGKDQPSNGG